MMVFLLTSVSGSASWQERIYDAYINGRMDRWKMIIDDMEQQKQQNSGFLAALVNYQYGYIAWCIGEGKTAEAREYLRLADDNLAWIEKHSSTEASLVHSYKSAFYGFRIGLSRLRAPVLGPRSVSHARQAMELEPGNPFGYIQYGNSQYYMPSIFGGSKQTAIEYYQKAQAVMEQNPGHIKNDWNYLNLLTLIAQAFQESGNFQEAEMYYLKILETEPRFLWVKNELYPAFLKTKGNE